MNRIFEFEHLNNAELIVDALYKGGNDGNVSDDPISKVIRCGNQSGFRFIGSADPMDIKYVVLYSSMDNPDWPDYLDYRNGQFFYYGDNRTPGRNLHDTPRKGNLILKNCFDLLSENNNNEIPPFFIFTKAGKGRDVIFRGLAVPGAISYESTDNLVAIWKSQRGERFQNYRAIFTVLDIQKISRDWINDLENGLVLTDNTPSPFKTWVKKNSYTPLISEKSVEYRTKNEQLPQTQFEKRYIKAIYEYFDDPFEFEKCAA